MVRRSFRSPPARRGRRGGVTARPPAREGRKPRGWRDLFAPKTARQVLLEGSVWAGIVKIIWTSVRGADVKAVSPADRGRSGATTLDAGEHHAHAPGTTMPAAGGRTDSHTATDAFVATAGFPHP